MQDVGVREFRDNASSLLSGDEPLAVRHNSRLLRLYLPAKQKGDGEELRSALREARESLAALRRETGLSEEDSIEEILPEKRRVDVNS